MSKDVARAEPRRRVHKQEAPDEVLGRVGHIRPLLSLEGVPSLDDAVADVAAEERGVPGQHHEQQAPQSPKVNLLVARARRQDLRGGVQERADLGLQLDPPQDPATEAEVDDLDNHVLRPITFLRIDDKDILGLDVPMHDAMLVAIQQGGRDLLDDLHGIGLAEAAKRHDAVEELATCDALHNQVEALSVLVHVQESANAWVVQRFQQLDLRVEVHHRCL
mmetsp:Transcript_50130/g.144433  ORF Transcript_50130/g.144433 Transcript_50130/m.144433 type:complete len:220 (+) Transcript_50130:694-1353(+)